MCDDPVRLGNIPGWDEVCTNVLRAFPYDAALRLTISRFSPTSDLGYGNEASRIYSALQDSWKVALDSGAKVLALTIPECAVNSPTLNARRAELNSLIKAHQSERL